MGAASKKAFADAVVSRFGKAGPAADETVTDDTEDDSASGTDNEAAAMVRAALKSGDNKALVEGIRRIAG